MINRRRDPHTGSSLHRSEREYALDGRFMNLEEFWDFLADETEAMSDEELRAEMDSLRVQRVREIH